MNTPHAPETPAPWAVITAYFMIYVVWGSTYYAVGVALRDFPPFLLGGLRFAAAGGLLLCVCALRGERVFHAGLIGRSAVSGIVLLFVDMAVIMLAQRHLGSGLVAVLASSTVFWITLLDKPMWKRNLRSPAVMIGILAGFLGVFLLFAEQLDQNGARGVQGVLLVTAGCVSWALGTLYTQYKTCPGERENEFAGAGWQMLSASAAFALASAIAGETGSFDWDKVSLAPWSALVYLVLFGSILAYTSYIWLLKVRPAAEVGTHAYANPLVAVLLGATLGGETVSGAQWAGLAAILVGIFWIRRPSSTFRREASLRPSGPSGPAAGPTSSDLSPHSTQNTHHMQHIKDTSFHGERPLFAARNLKLEHVAFLPGESALKECSGIEAIDCEFNGKYPFWHNDDFVIRNCVFREGARAAIWYARRLLMTDTLVEAPKMFRDMEELKLQRVRLPFAQETLWHCRRVELEDVEVEKGDYLFMHGSEIRIRRFKLHGNYSFQYCRDVVIRDAEIHSKDAFWNTDNVTVYDSVLNGEYLGWHSRNLRLVNCRISGTQPLCYAENLVMENCTMADDADLAFEYSSVRADIAGNVHSVKNPLSGSIVADGYGEIILDTRIKAPGDCAIETRGALPERAA